jgi:hypothetical protein
MDERVIGIIEFENLLFSDLEDDVTFRRSPGGWTRRGSSESIFADEKALQRTFDVSRKCPRDSVPVPVNDMLQRNTTASQTDAGVE